MKIEDIENPSKVELIKQASQGLSIPILEDLQSDEEAVSEASFELLKFHGTYQQDNRDTRIVRKRAGLGKEYSFMIRNRIPGGKLTADQFLAQLELAETFGNGSIRLTTRQSIQIHGVVKKNLRQVIHAINKTGLSTQSACGDVNRNVMCCPAPFKNDPIRREMQALALYLADLLKPKTESYSELWLTDPDTGEKTNILPSSKPMEPLYGELYMPRKFKVGIAKCDDNCIDVYDQDVGLLAISDGSKLIGYNVLAGGGMGTKPSDQRCFPALAKRLTFVTPEQVPVVVAAILLTQRDHGNRSDRKQARMKYLIHRWGLERFREAVQSRLVEAASIIGASENETPNTLPDPNPADVFFSDDHLGWFEQGDGKWFLGLPIESGRVKD
jgi:sulfite reductase (ferredoxin)